MVKCPWEYTEYLEEEENNWIIQLLIKKEVPLFYLKEPPSKQSEQVKNICNYLLGSRNFILLLSEDTSYVKEIYYRLAATWVVTADSGFEILDPIDLNPYHQDFENTIRKLKETSLLIIPYTDPSGYNLRKIKSTMGHVLSARKAARKPTITDLFIQRINIPNSELKNKIDDLTNIFGEQSPVMFMSEKSNSKIIKIRS